MRGIIKLLIVILFTPPVVFSFQNSLKTNYQKINRIRKLKAKSDEVTVAKAETLKKGDRVLLIGPGFLQLNIAKAAKASGLIPMIVAPQKKIESFKEYVNDDELMSLADIGLPDEKRMISGVVFCSEEAVFSPSLVKTVLEWEDGYVHNDGPAKVIACVPVSEKVNKDKSMGWMPIFNNDKNEKENWRNFLKAFNDHPVSGGNSGNIIRIGSLLGGSVDGIPELENVGLDECIYKMSLENFRDLRERAFDRYRLGAQILEGDALNIKPSNQDELEKKHLEKNEHAEVFRSTGGYPEVDRTCRHTAAQAVVQALLRPTRGQFYVQEETEGVRCVPKEFTVLSKCVAKFPTEDEWDELFENPGPAAWPDPKDFDPSQFDLE